MKKIWSKLWFLLQIQFQNLVEYKWDIIIYSLSGFVLPLVLMAVWLAVAQSTHRLQSQQTYIVTYFFLQIIIGKLVSAWQAHFMGLDIKRGDISQSILRPYPYIWHPLTENLSEKVWKFGFALPFIVLLGFVFKSSISYSFHNIFMSCIAILNAFIITFLINQIIGITAFWFSEPGAVESYNEVLFYLTSGKLFPLIYIANTPLFFFVNILPYKYMLGFPIDVLMGKINGEQMVWGVLTSCAWCFFLYMMYRLLWFKGLQRYGGYGG